MKKIIKALTLCILLSLISCKTQPAPSQIMTVTGAITATDLGKTLPHEHILVDFIGADKTGPHRWNAEQVVDKVLPQLNIMHEYGLDAIIECTPEYMGRDPLLLKELSEKSGLFLLTNTGYYGAYSCMFLPSHAFTESAEQLSDRWIAEWENGINGTGIKPGFIKIAVDGDSSLSIMHKKLVHAAAKTHLATGLVINSHTGSGCSVFEQLEILKKEGVDPSAFIWTHAQHDTTANHILAAKQGVWISLDKVNDKPEVINWYVDLLLNMKNNHMLHKALVSHDAGWYHAGIKDGGKFRDYTPVFKLLVPALTTQGFTDNDLDQIFVKNPQNAYTIRVRPIGQE